MSTPLRALAEHGQSLWIDYLSREFVCGGDLATLIAEGVIGASNPTIFQAAIAEGDSYDEQPKFREPTTDPADRHRIARTRSRGRRAGVR